MEKTKAIAFYLPQYHSIPENDAWWGKGFTEWTNVKSGKPLYKGHYQPKVPYLKNYYNLLEVETLMWQAQLANEYGVDGFCFYHYWFTGKKLLEKPAELLLSHPEIQMNYCFSWANETWSRRWTGEEKNILIKQEYGGINDWEEHFQYLLPFLKDPRYIKVDNRAVLLLYRAFNIPHCDEMIDYWNGRMKKEGMKELYVIETLEYVRQKGYLNKSSAHAEFEPMYTVSKDMNYWIRGYRCLFRHLKLFNFGFRYILSYDKIWELILGRKRYEGKKVYLGAFTEWDNTARRGKAGLIIRGGNPVKFEECFLKQYQRSMDLENEFIFINAWNEWGEGAYLEPDEKYMHRYLEAIKRVKEINM